MGDVSLLQKELKKAKKEIKDFQKQIENPQTAFIQKNLDLLAMERATEQVRAHNRELAKTKSTYKEIGQSVGSRISKGISSLFNTSRLDLKAIQGVRDLYKLRGNPISSYGTYGLKQLMDENTIDMGFKGALLNLRDGLVDTAKFFTQKIGDGIRSIGRGLKSGASSLREDFRPRNVLTTLGGGVGSVIGAGVSLGKGAIAAIPGVLSKSWEMVKGIGSFLLELPSKLMTVFSTLNPFAFLTQSFTQFKTIVVMGLGALTYEALKLHAEFEAVEVGFSSLLKSRADAKALVGDIRQLATETPFRSRELLQSARLLLGYGTAAHNIIPALRMLGDVTAAIGGEYINLEHVTYLFGTLQQQAHAFTRDMNQFANIGIPVIPEVAKILGIRPDEVMQATEEGRVKFNHVAKAFINMTKEGGHFYNFMEAKSKTLAGRWENFKDQAEIALARVGEYIAEEFNLKSWLGDLSSGLRNIDTWISKNRTQIKEFFDIVKGIGNATAQVFLHIGAGFKVAFEMAQAIFPNTFAYMDKLIKQGKDWTNSWEEAKDNMTGIFESIGVGFASMLDSIVNGFAEATNNIIKIRRALPGSGWSTSEQKEHVFNVVPEIKEFVAFQNALKHGINEKPRWLDTHEGPHLKYMESVFRRYGKEELFNTIRANDPEFKSAAAKAILNQGIQYLQSQGTGIDARVEAAKAEYDRTKGFGLYNTNSNMQQDVKSFFQTFRETQKAQNAERRDRQIEQAMYDRIVHRQNLLLSANALSPMGMSGFGNKSNPFEIQNPLDTTEAGILTDAVRQVYGDMWSQGIIEVTKKKFRELSDLNTGYWEDLVFNVKRKLDPKRKFDVPYESPVTHEMIEWQKHLDLEMTPIEEFNKHMMFVKTLGGAGRLTVDKQARAIAGILDKAQSAMGIGFDNIKFADAITKGSSEAVSLENKWKLGSQLSSPLEIANAIAADGLQTQKSMERHLEAIKLLLGGSLAEEGPMPREVNP